ncbi:MAG: hypothetical protein ABWY57_15250 [Mycetocola sp.]
MSRITESAADGDNEAGLTMIELIIYSVLAMIVLALVGSLLINALRGQDVITTSTQATDTGQLISKSVKRSIANASDVNSNLLSDGSELLVVYTLGPGSAPVHYCQGWLYDAPTHKLYMKRTTTVAPITANIPGNGWTLIGEGISPTTTRVFTPLVGPSGGITLDFTVKTGTRKPVLINTSVAQRIQRSENTGCF